MVRRQLSAKSLPEPLLTYCQLDLYKQISVTFCFKARHFIFEENTCDHTVCQWQPVRICVNVLTRNSRGGESSKTATTLFTGVCIQHSEDKMTTIWQTAFSNSFSSLKIVMFRFSCHWDMFLHVQLTSIQHWFTLWLGVEQATSHYLNQWWTSLVTDICVTRSQWVDIVFMPSEPDIITWTPLKAWCTFIFSNSSTCWTRARYVLPVHYR